jgi:hypothetical protein
MSNTPIQQAKLKLPLPLLMEQLGLGEHAKQNARCPFHDDRNPSFSVFQIDGSWFFKCHAGCGQGDEIAFLERYYGTSNAEAIKRYMELAGGRIYITTKRKEMHQAISNNGAQALPAVTAEEFNWDDCVAAFRESDLQRLTEWRGYREDTVRLLLKEKKIGNYEGCVAFPVEDHAGHVVGAHYRLRDGTWRYTSGVKAAPLIIGDIGSALEIHITESPWDAIALLDRLPVGAHIATNGAGNAGLLADLLPRFNPSAKVCLWPQNDAAGRKWFDHVSRIIPQATCVGVSTSHKDLNDWTKASANWDVLSAAVVESQKTRSRELVLNKSALPDLATLLSEIVTVLQQNITFSSEHQAIVVALWIAHTHIIDYLNTTPYLHITSPVKRCGKSNLLKCLNCLASKPWYLANLSVAVLYRKIERDCPTLLLDEAERSFEGGEGGRQDFLAILNCGYKRGATVYRCGGADRDRLDSFAVFCPKAFAGIGDLPDTTQDRCLTIRLERQVPGRRRRFLEDHVEREMAPMRERLAEWAKTEDAKNKLSITLLDFAFPESLTDRAVEVCEPLYKIAIAAGGDWYERARDATRCIFGAEEDENQATSQLAAIRDAFQEDDRLSTSELIDRLLDRDDPPFPNWWLKETDKKVIGKSLAKILKPFGVKAKKFRIDGEQMRGYERVDLDPVFGRYCTPVKVGKPQSSDLDVLDVSPSVTPNDQRVNSGHLMSTEPRTGSSCPKLSFQYPTTYAGWDMCDIETEKEEVNII